MGGATIKEIVNMGCERTFGEGGKEKVKNDKE